MIVNEVFIGGGKVTVELIENAQQTRFTSGRVTNNALLPIIVRVWMDGIKEIEATIQPGRVASKNLPANKTIQAYAESMAFGVHIRLA